MTLIRHAFKQQEQKISEIFFEQQKKNKKRQSNWIENAERNLFQTKDILFRRSNEMKRQIQQWRLD